jgi:DNA-binding NtrC family response regulator/tetratricopeptide (TPR) repeat protein
MEWLADRFLPTDDRDEALDLATRMRVRLFVDRDLPPGAARERTAACDRLALLRHPLLMPLVDYGLHGRSWFEAHERVAPVRMSADQRRRAVLHVVRFLRAAGVEPTSEWAMRNVRTAIDGVAAWRPLGVCLRDRGALEALRTLLEGAGPPGATAVDVIAPPGGGLRTARVLVARMARLAGFVVVDAQVEASWTPALAGRHVCVLEWLPRGRTLPPALAAAATSGGRRHIWIRFCRAPLPPSAAARAELRLEPMMSEEWLGAIFLDAETGPTAEDVRMAAEQAHGWPGPTIDRLSGMARGRGGAGWVHETSPEYGAGTTPPAAIAEVTIDEAGAARFRRAAEAARRLARRERHAHAARVLARCAPALAARGAPDEAASALCELGDLMLGRGQAQRAADAFAQARAWARAPAVVMRALVGCGRAFFDLARLSDAEAVFRTAAAADEGTFAKVWLARALWRRGDLDGARAAVGDAAPALLARILLAMGQVEDAATAVQLALASPAADEAICDAHVAAAHLHAATRDEAGVRRDIDTAIRAARADRRPALGIVIAAEGIACLERCGAPPSSRERERLLRAAAHLPPLASMTVRGLLQRAAPARPTACQADLVQHFQRLIDAIHDTPDEAAGLQVIASGLLETLSACSVTIRSARLQQVVAAAGRPWPGEEALGVVVLNGGAGRTRDGATPDAVEPIGAAGAVTGSLAVRWVAGANPGWDRVRDLLRATAVAAAPLLRALRLPEPSTESAAAFPDDLLGRGVAAQGVRDAIRRAASAPYPVLIEGESGSGKEVVARAIHARSVRRARRFCAVNCAALTDDLLEAELFGHARGSFTGAVSDRPGLFEDADQGTLFLDEVGELSARAQAKLLRVLQESEVRRVGENLPRRVDVRVVAATNRSLEQEALAGRFRGDLRFRLDVIRIAIPPLRDRADDLPWLAERIWADAAARVGSRAVLGPELIGTLARYDWPGNVRELQNVIASLAVHGPRRGRMPVALLPVRIAQEAARPEVGFDEARLDFERRFVRAALARAGGQRALAAGQLGVSRQGLTKILKRLGLE